MIQYLPMIANAAQTVFGAVNQGKERRRMAGERQKWGAENEALFNEDYYSDYTKRADAQNVIRQMRDQNKKADKVEQNVAAVTGATPEAMNAGKERRNKMTTDVYSNIAANAMQYKDRAKGRYLSRKAQLQGLDYDAMGQSVASAGNVMGNGLKGLASTDWAGIMGGGKVIKDAVGNTLTAPTQGKYGYDSKTGIPYKQDPWQKPAPKYTTDINEFVKSNANTKPWGK